MGCDPIKMPAEKRLEAGLAARANLAFPSAKKELSSSPLGYAARLAEADGLSRREGAPAYTLSCGKKKNGCMRAPIRIGSRQSP